jgi:signal transduction histidine kinase
MRAMILQSWPARILAAYFKPRSSQPIDAFREQALRVVILVAFVFFCLVFVFALITNSLAGPDWFRNLVWYVFFFTLLGWIWLSLRAGNVRRAGRTMVMSIVLILIDPSRAYWSPGTVIFGFLFTFVFELVLDNWRDITVAVLLNLGVYTWITFGSGGVSPLRPDDYFSAPFSALLTVYTSHLIIIGIAYFIRREQRERDRIDLLLQQHQVDVLRQFLGHSSHDLRTALTKIRLPLYRLGQLSTAENQPALAALTLSVNELETLLLTMLEMAQLDDVSQFIMTVVDVQRMVAMLIQQMTPAVEQKHQTLTVSNAPAALTVRANEEYLSRAVRNVIDNAIKFTPEHGTLTIKSTVEADQVVIAISDSGMGIEAAKLPHIFDRFFRGDAARTQSPGKTGMGLGLSITKKIIDLHGGTITIDSIEGQGTTGTIRLPRYKAKPLPASAKQQINAGQT